MATLAPAFRQIGFREARALHPRPPGARNVPAALEHACGRKSLFSSVTSGYDDDLRRGDGTIAYARVVVRGPGVHDVVDRLAGGRERVYRGVHGRQRAARVRVLPLRPGARAYTLVPV